MAVVDGSRADDLVLPVECAVVIMGRMAGRMVGRTVDRDGPPEPRALLEGIEAAAPGLRTHVVLVEPGDAEATRAALADLPGVTVVGVGDGLGHAAGLNLGVAVSPPAQGYLFLGPDVTPSPGSVTRLLRASRRPGVGAVVPRVLDGRGGVRRSLRREPRLLSGLGEAVLGGHWRERPAPFAEMVREPWVYDHARPVDWATGAAVLVTARAAVDVGGWDEGLRRDAELTDYLVRLRRAGHLVLYEPEATVVSPARRSPGDADLEALRVVHRVGYHAKHHGRRASVAAWLLAAVHSGLRIRRPGSRRALRSLLGPSPAGTATGSLRPASPGSGRAGPRASRRTGRSAP